MAEAVVDIHSGDRATSEGVPSLSLEGGSGKRGGANFTTTEEYVLCVCVSVCVCTHARACEGAETIWNLLWVERKAHSKPGGESP